MRAGGPDGELPGGEELGERVPGRQLVLPRAEGLLHPAEEGSGQVVGLATGIHRTLLGETGLESL